MEKVGLVLEGGGMRGLYTIGVLDCLYDEEILFQNIIGVSAGACNATSYLSGQRGRNLEINTRFIHDKRYISYSGLVTRGSIFGMDFIFDEIPKRLLPYDYEAFYASGCHLTVVATDCKTGTARYLCTDGASPDEINRMVRASSSLPLLAPTVTIDGYHLVDGGTADSIPLRYFEFQGFTKNVVILTQNAGYRKAPNTMWWACRIRYPQYPKLAQAMRDRHLHYNDTLDYVARQEKAGNAFVLRPSEPITVSRTEKDYDKLYALYQNGYEDMKRAIPALREFLSGLDGVRYTHVISKQNTVPAGGQHETARN